MANEPQPDSSGAPDLKFAHYRVLRRADGSIWELGRGAMGVTYKAYDEQLRIEVALKVITPGQVDDAKAQALFLREARAAARVRHPNVASVVYLNTTPGNFFYAMEFIAGESLQDWLKTRGTLPPAMATGFATQIARGLGAIHEQQIVHRDLKPANLMIVGAAREKSRTGSDSNPDAWQVKIIDFGLARGFGAEGLGTEVNAQTTGFRGTALYASPEQCEEHGSIDGRSDQYSLGCIWWEMLTGATPFRGRSHRELLNQHVSQMVPRERIAHLPAGVQAVLARMLEKDPANRFADADAVVEALQRCRERGASGGDSIDAIGVTTHDAPDRAKSPTAAIEPSRAGGRAVALPLLAAALLAAGVLWWLGRAQPSAPASASSPTPTPAASPTIAPAVARKAIAVLPFANLSAEKENEYFADGIHEDVLSNISKINDLRVISRSSVQPYRGANRNLRQIANDLNVSTVLEGSVRRAGNRVRISTQLIDARTDELLWSETYDRDMKDVFEIQTDVSQNIAKALKARLSPAEAVEIRDNRAGSIEAYDLYLRGQAELRKQTKADVERAIDYFKEATGKDPAYALAYAALSSAYTLKVAVFDDSPVWLDAAIQSAEKAISLDAKSAEGYAALAQAYRHKGWQRRSLEAFEKALALNPNLEQAASNLAWIYLFSGRYEESWRLLHRVLGTTPDDAAARLRLGELYFALGEAEKGERWFRRGIVLLRNASNQQQMEIALAYSRKDYHRVLTLWEARLGPGRWANLTAAKALGEMAEESPPGYFAAMSAARLGNWDEFRDGLQAALGFADPDGFNYRQILTSQAYLLRHDGRDREMRETCTKILGLVQRAVAAGNEFWEPNYNGAYAYWLLGDHEASDRQLDLALKAGLFLGKVDQDDSNADVLLGNPRFVAAIAEMSRKIEIQRARINELEKQYP